MLKSLNKEHFLRNKGRAVFFSGRQLLNRMYRIERKKMILNIFFSNSHLYSKRRLNKVTKTKTFIIFPNIVSKIKLLIIQNIF